MATKATKKTRMPRSTTWGMNTKPTKKARMARSTTRMGGGQGNPHPDPLRPRHCEVAPRRLGSPQQGEGIQPARRGCSSKARFPLKGGEGTQPTAKRRRVAAVQRGNDGKRSACPTIRDDVRRARPQPRSQGGSRSPDLEIGIHGERRDRGKGGRACNNSDKHLK